MKIEFNLNAEVKRLINRMKRGEILSLEDPESNERISLYYSKIFKRCQKIVRSTNESMTLTKQEAYGLIEKYCKNQAPQTV